MLVLTRYPGQEILVGDDMRIIVLASGPRGTRLGIEAPKDITILRSELKDRDISDPRGNDMEIDGNQ